MVLSDRSIKEEIAAGRIVVSPLGQGCIQPASVDVHLDKSLLVFRNSRRPYIDVRQSQDGLTEMTEIGGDVPFMLHPGEFVLGSTMENIELPDDLVARLEGKSSLGRIGLLIHSTAGYVDPGWKGHLTLELSNVSNLPSDTLRRHEDRADILPAPDDRGRKPVRVRRAGQQVPRPDRAHPQPHPPGLHGRALRRVGVGTAPPYSEAARRIASPRGRGEDHEVPA